MSDLLSILDEIGGIDSDSLPHERAQSICRLSNLLLNTTSSSSLESDDLVAVVLFLNQELQSTSSNTIGGSSLQMCALLQVTHSLMQYLNNTLVDDDTLLGELPAFLEAALALIYDSSSTTISSVKLSVLRLIPAVCLKLSTIFSDDNDKQSEREQIGAAVVKALSTGLRDQDASVVISSLDCMSEVLLNNNNNSKTSLSSDIRDDLISSLCEVASSSSNNNNTNKQSRQPNNNKQGNSNNNNLTLFLSSSAADCLNQTLSKLSGISNSIKKLSGLLMSNNRQQQQQDEAAATKSLSEAFFKDLENDNDDDNDIDDDIISSFMKLPALVRPEMIQLIDQHDAATLNSAITQQQQTKNTNNNNTNKDTIEAQREAEEKDLQEKVEAVIRSLKAIPSSQDNAASSSLSSSNNNNNNDITNIEQWHLDGLRYMQQQTVRLHMQRELERLQEHEKRGIARIPVGQMLTSLPSCAETLDIATQLHENDHLRNASMTTLVTTSIAAFPTVAAKDQPRCSAVISRLISKMPFNCVDRVLDEILESLGHQILTSSSTNKTSQNINAATTDGRNTNNADNSHNNNNQNSNSNTTDSQQQSLLEGLSYAFSFTEFLNGDNNNNNSEESTSTAQTRKKTVCDPPFPSYRLMIQLLYSLYSQLATNNSSDTNNNNNRGGNTFFLDEDDGDQQRQKNNNNEDGSNNNEEYAFEQDLILDYAALLQEDEEAAAQGNNNNSDSPTKKNSNNTSSSSSSFFGGFNLKNPLSWLMQPNNNDQSDDATHNKNRRRRQRMMMNVIDFQEDTYNNAYKSSLGHATLRFLNFIFDIATTELRLPSEKVQQVMTQVLLDLPVIPTSAWLFLHVHLCSGKLPSEFLKPNILCLNGLRILSNIAMVRHSDTWKSLSFLLHYTRSADRFPRTASCVEIVNFLAKVCQVGNNKNINKKENSNNNEDEDEMMMMMFAEEKIFLRKLIGKFALYSAQACCDAENTQAVLKQQQQEAEKQKDDDAASPSSSTTVVVETTTTTNPTGIALITPDQRLSRGIALAAKVASVDNFVAEDFFKFLLETYAREPVWRQALRNSQEVDTLIKRICENHSIDEMLTTIREHYPSGSEPFVSHLLFLVKERIFTIALSSTNNNLSPDEQQRNKELANFCALSLKAHCDNLVHKSHDVRFWCPAAAFHSTSELRQQTIPAIISCFDAQETISDGEAGLRNCVLPTSFFMGGTDGVDRGISTEELLEQLIVVSAKDSATFSARSQQRAISAFVDLKTKSSSSSSTQQQQQFSMNAQPNNAAPLIRSDSAQRVLEKFRVPTTQQQQSGSSDGSNKDTTISSNNNNNTGGGVLTLETTTTGDNNKTDSANKSSSLSTTNTTTTQQTPPLLMRTINLLLSREPNDHNLRRFASVVARNLVIGQVWTYDLELWRGVQSYLEQEVQHFQKILQRHTQTGQPMTQMQQQQFNVNQQQVLTVIQSMSSKMLSDLCNANALLKNFIRQYQPELLNK